MNPEGIREILQKGEGTEIEFKTSQFELNRDAFESICAFLNRKGGHLLLGKDEVIQSVLPHHKTDAILRVETTQITTQIISERIIDLVRRNPAISRRKLAEVLGDITEDGVKYHQALKSDFTP